MGKKYLALWFLLAISLGAVATVAFIDDFTVFGIPFKKAPIADALLGNYQTSAEIAQAKQQEAQAAQRKAAKPSQLVPVDTASQNILVFGDSMSQNIALRLAAYAKKNGHKLHTVNWDSSGTRIWSSCDTLDHYIRRYKPSFIFVSLGGNEFGFKNPEALAPHVDVIVKKIGKIPFIWIGPPSLKNDMGISTMLLSHLPAGTFFRSDSLKLERRKDQIHPTVAGAAIQIDSLARWMKYSAHPIKMVFPDDSLSHTKIRDINVTYLKPLH